MYTNPFNRTHCKVRQIIDKFLHVDTGSRNYKTVVKRTTSNCSDSSYKSSQGSVKSTKSPSFLRRSGVFK